MYDKSCEQCVARVDAIKERAAIMEYDGGVPRRTAQVLATAAHSGKNDRRTCVHAARKDEGPRG